MDIESRSQNDDHHSLRMWLRLLTCTNLVENSVRDYLRRAFNCTLPRFDMMAQLIKHPAGLTMGQLAQFMMVSGGNITGIAKQLEKDGLLLCKPLKEDQRSYVARLTPKGKKYFNEMAGEHEQWIIELFECLDTDEIEQLLGLLGKLKRHIRTVQNRPANTQPTIKVG